MKQTLLRVVAPAPSRPPAATAPPAARRHPLDLYWQSRVARATGGISPIAMQLAFQDWWQHLAVSPGKCGELATFWLTALGDLRIALAERVGIDNVQKASTPQGLVYAWLTWLQGSLVEALDAA